MPKLLGEFLEEQQEPFILDDYLLERGYCTPTRPNACPGPQNSLRFLNIKRRGPILNCTHFVSAVLKRLVLKRVVLHENCKIRNPRVDRFGESVEHNYEDEDEDDFTTASATTLYSSCLESSDAEYYLTKQSDSSIHELEPISFLEETESEASPLHQKRYKFKKTKGESSSKKPKHKSVANFEEHCMDSHDQFIINKRALKQQKKLLVDCVRVLIEKERIRGDERGQQQKRILGAEELWKVVCENVWLWSQESVHENNILHLLHCDLMASLQEWSSEVFMEIGDVILEDVIHEIFTN